MSGMPLPNNALSGTFLGCPHGAVFFDFRLAQILELITKEPAP
jgi:hypothetical protein